MSSNFQHPDSLLYHNPTQWTKRQRAQTPIIGSYSKLFIAKIIGKRKRYGHTLLHVLHNKMETILYKSNFYESCTMSPLKLIHQT